MPAEQSRVHRVAPSSARQRLPGTTHWASVVQGRQAVSTTGRQVVPLTW